MQVYTERAPVRGATGFDRSSDSGAPYYFHKQADRTAQGWEAHTLGIGLEPTPAQPDRDRGTRIDLFAQLVTEETAQVLRDRANIAIGLIPPGPP